MKSKVSCAFLASATKSNSRRRCSVIKSGGDSVSDVYSRASHEMPTSNKVDRKVEYPVLVHPHDNLERSQIPSNLFAHRRLLDLHRDPLPVMRLCSMNLSHGCTRRRFMLKNGEDTFRPVWEPAEFLLKDLEDGLVGDLGCVVEELGKSTLECTRKESRIGPNGLTYLTTSIAGQ
jgi:hypothetical protein